MAKKRPDKDCWEMRVCIDRPTNKAIIEYQATKISKNGLETYLKSEAASDLFMELVRKEQERTLMEGAMG